MRVAGAERLHRRFLRGEPPREMHRGHAAARTIVDLAVGEHAVHEAIAVAAQRVGDAGNLGGVESKADDVRHL